MPKLGMEPVRRKALITATICEIGDAGTLDVTVAQIARRAGMSSALAHHYFGGKEDMFLAAMRHVLRTYGQDVLAELTSAKLPLERLHGIIRASFLGDNFRPEVIAAWMNFYVLAQKSDEARRMLRIYQQRARSNLAHALRPLVGAQAGDLAEMIASLIDGVYLRHGLSGQKPDGQLAVTQVLGCLDAALAGGGREQA